MKLSADRKEFDDLQQSLLREFIDTVYRSLMDAGVPRAKVPPVLTEIAFHICCAIDGSTVMRRADGRILPVLTFAKNATPEELIFWGTGSWMHEYVHDAVDEYLKAKL
jgi:hypothetical protein